MKSAVLLSLGIFVGAALFAQASNPDGAGVETGVLPAAWMTGGPKCIEVPDWEVHEYNTSFYILRQSGCTNYEKPFLYLFFGENRAMLVDTGAKPSDAAAIVKKLISKWAEKNHKQPLPLTVTHSHAHGDHTAGDAGFAADANVTLVKATVPEVQKAFGITQWPDQPGSIDLGNRVIDVLGIPGHDAAHLAYYDRRTGVLLTGDHLYAGRLYVADFAAYEASTQRLVKFTEGKIVTHILGCHIEQTATPYLDYGVGTMYQPNEHSLALSRGNLLELQEALAKSHSRAAYRDFTVWPMDAAGRADLRRIMEQTKAKQAQQ